jgi:hypothetical protein
MNVSGLLSVIVPSIKSTVFSTASSQYLDFFFLIQSMDLFAAILPIHALKFSLL